MNDAVGRARESSEGSMQAVNGDEMIVVEPTETLETDTSQGHCFARLNSPIGYVCSEKFPNRREVEYPPRIRVPLRTSERSVEGMP